jgi:hypothetical protein
MDIKALTVLAVPWTMEATMDIRALKVGQKVVLSEALPNAGATGVVTAVTKARVNIQVNARIEGVDGAYCVWFNFDGSVDAFCDWTDRAGWEGGSPCPIPDLKIISSEEVTR